MSLLAFTGSIVFLGVLVLLIYRDLSSPAFLMLIPWFISLVFIFGSNLYYQEFSMSYLYIVIGLLSFQFFYRYSFVHGIKKSWYLSQRQHYIDINTSMKINAASVFVIVILETLSMFYYLRLTNADTENIGGIFEYIHKMVFAVFYLVLIHLFSSVGDERKKTIRLLILQLVPVGIALALQSNGRASYFSFIFTVLFIYLSFHSESIIKVLKVGLIAFFLLIGIFVYVALRKRQIISGGASGNFMIQIRNWITHYTSSPIVTFSMWFPKHSEYFSFGTNTFRIFKAILFKMGVPVDVPTTIFPFMRVSPGVNGISNVYTIYYTYIIDFGLLGGILVQAFLGYLYGKLYKMKDSYKTGYVFAYSIMMYALLMEVFGDQYVATASSFLQMYLWYFVFYKCQILYSSNLRRIKVIRE